MQTLEIRVEQKRNRLYFSKSRQNETLVSKTEKSQQISERFAYYLIRG